MSGARIATGRRAEDLAAAMLARHGLRLVARNLRLRYRELGVAGELDLVALDGATLVIVEVKARRAGAARGPERAALAVGPAKRLRLRRLARAWLASGPELPRFAAIRFDVVGVELDAAGRVVELEWLREAF